jgi:UTP-glucose-1-phosphate uridylyltransferase
MSPQVPTRDPETIGAEQIPQVEVLLTDTIARLLLAAHVYLSAEEGKQPDVGAAETSIDVATSAFERIKERLRPEERLAITQLLTETRMTFVKKRGL